MNFRKLHSIIRDAEQKAEDPTRRVFYRSAYLELEVAARRVLAEELIEERDRRADEAKHRPPAIGRRK